MIKPLVYYKNKILRTKCSQVGTFDRHVLSMIQDMKDSVVEHHGAGMGAPQIGYLSRVIVICFSKDDTGDDRPILSDPEVFINPEIIHRSEETIALPEGNLSIPGIDLLITRPKTITMKALNDKGEEVIEQATGWRARVIMHEIDHLDGILFFDHVSKEEQKAIEATLDGIDKTFSKKC